MRINKHGIVIIGPKPPPYSGPEIDIVNILSSEILKEGFELYHLNTQKHSNNEQKGTVSVRNFLLEIKHALLLSVLILLKRPKIVFLPFSQTDMGFLRDSVFIIISKVLRQKVAIYLTGGAYDVFYKRSRFPLFLKYIYKISDLIIALSESVKGQIHDILQTKNLGKIKIVPLDINLVPASGKFMKKENDCFRVLHLGHISVAKGALDLIRAIPIVVREFPDTKFLFAGNFISNERNIDFISDPHGAETKIRNFVKANNIEDKIEFLGFVIGKDKSSLLENVDVQVLASYSEGCPRAVLEGMLAGHPVVVTPAGNLKEIVINGENGFVVDFGRPEEIAKCICKLLGNRELRHKMGRSNRELIQKRFSSEKRFTLLKELFRETINGE